MKKPYLMEVKFKDMKKNDIVYSKDKSTMYIIEGFVTTLLHKHIIGLKRRGYLGFEFEHNNLLFRESTPFNNYVDPEDKRLVLRFE